MNQPFFIAIRYFFSKKKKTIINFISWLALVAVMVVTAITIIIMSGFNGMDSFVKNLFSTFDADLVIEPSTGKTFEINTTLINKINNTEGIKAYSQIIEDNALLKYKGNQTVIKVKGIESNFLKIRAIDSSIVKGSSDLVKDSIAYTCIGLGVYNKLNLVFDNNMYPLQFLYPKNKKLTGSINPSLLNRKNIFLGGVFAIERQYDENYVFVPLTFAQELTQFKEKRTSIEIEVLDENNINNIKSSLQKSLGQKFKVKDANDIHKTLFKAHNIEKFFTLMVISFILLIASLNIFFALSMLILEKKKDIAILKSLGSTNQNIFSIFLLNGVFISFFGTVLGLVLGYSFVILQQKIGFISMGMESALLDAYPMELRLNDFLITITVVTFTTLAVTYIPAKKASKIIISEQL